MSEEEFFDGIPLTEIYLTPGNWDIQYKDKRTFNTCIMRHTIKEKTYLKKLNVDGLRIVKIDEVK